jgi:hypothetical protein
MCFHSPCSPREGKQGYYETESRLRGRRERQAEGLRDKESAT